MLIVIFILCADAKMCNERTQASGQRSRVVRQNGDHHGLLGSHHKDLGHRIKWYQTRNPR